MVQTQPIGDQEDVSGCPADIHAPMADPEANEPGQQQQQQTENACLPTTIVKGFYRKGRDGCVHVAAFRGRMLLVAAQTMAMSAALTRCRLQIALYILQSCRLGQQPFTACKGCKAPDVVVCRYSVCTGLRLLRALSWFKIQRAADCAALLVQLLIVMHGMYQAAEHLPAAWAHDKVKVDIIITGSLTADGPVHVLAVILAGTLFKHLPLDLVLLLQGIDAVRSTFHLY